MHELGLKPKDRSGVAQNHLEPLVRTGVLVECQAIPEHGKEKRERKRDAHQLNPDPDTFAELLNIFIGTEHLEDFLHSPYVSEIDGTTAIRIIIDTISEHMKPVQALAKMVGLPSPEAHFSQRVSDVIAALAQAQQFISTSTFPPHTTFADMKRKLTRNVPIHNPN